MSTSGPVVLVHGPGWAGAGPSEIGLLLAAFEADPDAAVAILVRPTTDTLKSVDDDGLVTGTLDRAAHLTVLTPIAVRPGALPPGPAAPGPGNPMPGAAVVLAAAHADPGCRVLTVPAPS